MRNRRITAGLALAALMLAPGVGRVAAQEAYQVPGQDSFMLPLPLGHDRLETGGFYAGLELMYLIPNRSFNDQIIATRGLIDTTGRLSGTVGRFIGPGTIALATTDLSEVNWQPGVRYTLGWKFDSGVSVSLSYLQMFDIKETATAGPPPPLYNTGPDLSGSFLFSGVYNFPTDFAGPQLKTQQDVNEWNIADANPALPRVLFPVGFNAYGIWNGAATMEIALTRRFQEFDLTARLPVWDTEYARTYALTGGRFAWLFDRFWWRTAAIGANPNPADNAPGNVFFTGVSEPTDVAIYTLTLSQRMYGPFLGGGYEAYLGRGFAVNLDTTGALLFDIIKERAKYKLGDESVQNKRSRNLFGLVPNINANLNLTWYPVRGIQLRAGYNFMGFFNAKAMTRPVGFNYGAIEYRTDEQFIRFYNGFSFGFGLTF